MGFFDTLTDPGTPPPFQPEGLGAVLDMVLNLIKARRMGQIQSDMSQIYQLQSAQGQGTIPQGTVNLPVEKITPGAPGQPNVTTQTPLMRTITMPSAQAPAGAPTGTLAGAPTESSSVMQKFNDLVSDIRKKSPRMALELQKEFDKISDRLTRESPDTLNILRQRAYAAHINPETLKLIEQESPQLQAEDLMNVVSPGEKEAITTAAREAETTAALPERYKIQTPLEVEAAGELEKKRATVREEMEEKFAPQVQQRAAALAAAEARARMPVELELERQRLGMQLAAHKQQLEQEIAFESTNPERIEQSLHQTINSINAIKTHTQLELANIQGGILTQPLPKELAGGLKIHPSIYALMRSEYTAKENHRDPITQLQVDFGINPSQAQQLHNAVPQFIAQHGIDEIQLNRLLQEDVSLVNYLTGATLQKITLLQGGKPPKDAKVFKDILGEQDYNTLLNTAIGQSELYRGKPQQILTIAKQISANMAHHLSLLATPLYMAKEGIEALTAPSKIPEVLQSTWTPIVAREIARARAMGGLPTNTQPIKDRLIQQARDIVSKSGLGTLTPAQEEELRKNLDTLMNTK